MTTKGRYKPFKPIFSEIGVFAIISIDFLLKRVVGVGAKNGLVSIPSLYNFSIREL